MADQPRLADEIKKMEYEPLNSVEKKLISYSLILGVVLLGILVGVSYTYFPGAPEAPPEQEQVQQAPAVPASNAAPGQGK